MEGWLTSEVECIDISILLDKDLSAIYWINLRSPMQGSATIICWLIKYAAASPNQILEQLWILLKDNFMYYSISFFSKLPFYFRHKLISSLDDDLFLILLLLRILYRLILFVIVNLCLLLLSRRNASSSWWQETSLTSSGPSSSATSLLLSSFFHLC